MINPNSGDKQRRVAPSSRRARDTFVTKSGQTIKVHRNISERIKASRDARERKRAARLAGMPKTPVKRLMYRLHPKRMYKYWFSREGGIMALKITGIGIIASFLVLVAVFAYFRKDLPNLKDISGKNIGGSIRYYDRTGQTLLWEDYDAVKRIPVKDDTISQYMKDATVAIEDRDFFKHGGFDVRGIARAGLNDVFGSGPQQGGSTITQQLVKLNNNWTNNKTYIRKIKEVILAVELERSYTKQEILTGYLNTAPYGNVQYGVEAASRDYFAKSAKDLTLDESAFLAGLPKSPSQYSPYGVYYKGDPEYWNKASKNRQAYILDVMAELKMITKEQAEDAKKIDTFAKVQTPKPKFSGIKSPYFVLTAKEQLETTWGADQVKRGGWKVTTTLDMNAQKIAEEQVAKNASMVKRYGADEIGFAAEDVKTGQMVALVGGTNFFADTTWRENNYARLKIPPGSSIKPYVYASLLENTTNFGAGSVLYDTKGPIPGYPCTTGVSPTGNCAHDYNYTFPGPLTIRYSLGGSRNVPALKAMALIGTDKVVQTTKKLMQSPGTPEGEARGNYKCYSDEASTVETPCYTSSALGDGAYLRLDEHVHGYATLSRNGLNIPQTYILKIEDSAGKAIDEWKPSKGVQAIRADAAYIVSDMISDPRASYFTNKPHNYKGWKFGLKTGTTNDNKDALMMMMSTQYAAGVWVGYHNRTVAFRTDSGTLTVPIILPFMQKMHDNIKPEERVKPSGVKTLPAYVIRGASGMYGAQFPSPSTDLYPSWYVQSNKTTASKKTIDVVSNKLATDCTPSRARKEITDTNANSFSGDKFVAGGDSANTTESDDIHRCDDNRPSIEILDASSSAIQVRIGAGTHPLSSAQYPGTVSILIGGQTVQSFSASTSGTMTLNYNYSGSGSKDVQVVVVDSVLYDASDSRSVTFSGSSGGPNLTSASINGGNVKVNWTGGSGVVTIYRVNDNGVVCNGSGSSCSGPKSAAPAGTQIYAKDAEGNKSGNITVQ